MMPSSRTPTTSDDESIASSMEGELKVLVESLDEDAVPLTWSEVDEQLNGGSAYSDPLSTGEAKKEFLSGGSGVEWKVTIIPNECFVKGKLKKGLNPRDFDLKNQTVKPRRGSLPIRAIDLFSSLTVINGPNGPKYIFCGILNGWPALRCFELRWIEEINIFSLLQDGRYIINAPRMLRKIVWKASKDGVEGVDPGTNMDSNVIYRANLRGPPWSSKGWSKESPGFAYWFEAQCPEGPRITYGTDMITKVGNSNCTHVHMFSHRYAVQRESAKDRLTVSAPRVH